MRRQLLNHLTALSLLLCVAVVVLCVRGYRCAEFFRWSGTRTEWEVASSRGTVAFKWERIQPRRGTFYPGLFYSAGEPLPLDQWGYRRRRALAGLVWYGDGEFAREDAFVRRAVGLPALATAVALLILPVGRVAWGRVVTRAGAATACRRCAYDLRATPDRCPECGAAAAGTVA